MPVRRWATVTATAVVIVALSGCVQQTPTPLPQATPSWSCTPVTGGTPYACYENQYQQTAAQNKLYEEAEAVYRKFNAEDERIYRLGGVAEPTAVLLETLTGKALDSAMANYADLMSDGTKMVGGEFKTASVKRLLETKDGSVAALQVCSDVSAVTLKRPRGKAYSLGSDSDQTFYFNRVEDHLKIGDAVGSWVESC